MSPKMGTENGFAAMPVDLISCGWSKVGPLEVVVQDGLSSLKVDASVQVNFSWDYATKDERIRSLYEKAKAAQWNVSQDIDWSPLVEFGSPLEEMSDPSAALPRPADSPVTAERWNEFRWHYHAWLTSQFLHGEQGALLATSRLVETSPNMDDKFFAAVQVVDEARHVEAYSGYLDRLGQAYVYPINPQLATMLSQVVSESRWDVVFLGMQVIIEGIALALFRLGHVSAFDPVIRQITRLVAKDEARHVAFGVIALEGLYADLTSQERADREEFVQESILLMSRRFLLTEVWERMEIDIAAGRQFVTQSPEMAGMRRLMFAKVGSCLGHIGLLTPAIRRQLRELPVTRTGLGHGGA
jgi:P-aminobenzoate N-oxygenase AurF